MQFTIQREELLKPLQMVAGIAERRQTRPILANLLLEVGPDYLALTATDMEVELVARIQLGIPPEEKGLITVLARKLYDVCRSLPEGTSLRFSLEQERLHIRAGRSRFSLVTLPVIDFPKMEASIGHIEFPILGKDLYQLLHYPQFSMAEQDVRYYLNGVLLQLKRNYLISVATDGHRLTKFSLSKPDIEQSHQVIIPRKTILELSRLLNGRAELPFTVVLSQNHIAVTGSDFVFTSKLVDGAFPDYERAIPKNHDKTIVVDRDTLKDALTRMSILCHDKSVAVRLQLRKELLIINTNNPEYEEAQEEVDINYGGDDLDICFNIHYLLSALPFMPSGSIELKLANAQSSMLLYPEGSVSTALPELIYVLMPLQA